MGILVAVQSERVKGQELSAVSGGAIRRASLASESSESMAKRAGKARNPAWTH